MKSVLTKGKVPVKIWEDLENVESAAINQLTNLSNLPGVFKHIAVMPDVHLGKGSTIGSVMASKEIVVPAAVGVDIGCGMVAVQLNIEISEVDSLLPEIRSLIEKNIPVGRGEHKISFSYPKESKFCNLSPKVQDLKEKAARQIGTLGGGNHFIELSVDTKGMLWVVLHSGSRHIGKSIADVHISEAKGLMKKMLISLPDPDLAYLVVGTDEFKSYLHDLWWAQDYALYNRKSMVDTLLVILQHFVPKTRMLQSINCHHNYVDLERHFGEDVYVTRKGAVRAGVLDWGIIPGSMGTKTYIVSGKGDPQSFCSCSHGAGRRMSRSKAKQVFTVEDLSLQTQGVECRKDSGVLDEIPGAYKDIDNVMENQKDLVKIEAELKQILCVKG